MKILMVNKFLYSRGGAENYMLRLGDCLASLGHEVRYFGMYDEKNTVGNDDNLYTSNMDFHTKSIGRFLYPFKIIYSLEAKKKIGKVLDSFKPDIVHMNNINFQITPSIIGEVKKRNIPLVQTVHDYQMICPNHLLYNLSKESICEKCITGSKFNCAKYSCIHGSKVKSIIGSIEAILYSVLKTYKNVDKYICPSYFLENKLLESGDTFKGRTCTLHNFIEKATVSKKQDEEYIAFAGRISKEKGIEILAQAAKMLPDIKFVVAGTGPDEDILKGIENVHMTGFLTGEKLEEVISGAKALLVPSIWYENCPLSILEAHSMGTPVITMARGGMAELVKDNVNGILFSEPDAESLAAAIRKTTDESFNKIQENCIENKDDVILVENYCEDLLKVYNELTEVEKNA